MAPIGEYSDGTVNWAWPSILADGVQGWNSLADSAARARENPALMFDEDFNRQAAADSFNAAFDPAMADSANLLAANPRTAAAVPAGMAASEGDDMSNDPFLAYILRQYGGQ